MCSLSPIISRLSHGFPLFALSMKMKLNTPRNIRINDSQHCRMPCRISLVAWREHPHTNRFINWAIYIPRGLFVGFYPGVEKSSEWYALYFSFVHNYGFYAAAEHTGLVFTQLYSFPRSKYLLVTQNWMTSNIKASRTASRKLILPRVCPVCARNLVTFPSYKPLKFLFKQPP